MSRFEELRESYESFVYEGYTAERTESGYRVTYRFQIPGLAEFHPVWEFPAVRGKLPEQDEILNALFFHLGMAEVISYWKCACPREIEVRCGRLTDEQREWWYKLFYNGLGEFLYRNGIEVSQEALVRIVCRDAACAGGGGTAEAGSGEACGDGPGEAGSGEVRGDGTAEADSGEVCGDGPGEAGSGEVRGGGPGVLHDSRVYRGVLIPIGGGKDSVVSLELLRGEDVTTYCINGSEAIRRIVDICDYKREHYTARRSLDKRLLELNAQGFLNGHTPFSAIVAFSSVISAYLCGRRYIALSNETSANETTVRDSFVNHQYSKSYDFERDFCQYLSGVTDSDIHYFSLLRPLTEIQIAMLFSRFRQYHSVFRSCNAGSKKGIWCCECPKCLFVYIILLPFLSREELLAIFGEDLLEKESLDGDFRALMGIDENKPFECVGTRREVRIALKSFVEKGGRSLLTERYRGQILAELDTPERILRSWTAENSVPPQYSEIVKRQITR